MAKSRAQAGFTVIELMVAVAVVSILLTVGVPAFGSLIDKAGRVRSVHVGFKKGDEVALREEIKTLLAE